MLTTLKIWDEGTASQYHYSPVQTWPNSGDKHMHVYKRLEDRSGDNYYVSHPPFAFMLGHLYFYLTGTEPSQIPLQIIGFFLHFVGGLALFWLMNNICRDKIAAFISFGVFSFYPVLLFGYTFHFFTEIIGITLWMLMAGDLCCLLDRGEPTKMALLTLGFLNLLFVYTDWTGVFFSFSMVIFLFLKKDFHARKLAATLQLSLLIGLVMIIYQYSRIAGFNAMLSSMSTRLIERSGFFGSAYSDQQLSIFSLEAYKILALQFHHHMKWLGYGFLLLSVLALSMRKVRKAIAVPSFLWWAFVIPALLHFILFFNTNVLHYVYQAKWAVLVAIFSGLFISIVKRNLRYVAIGLIVLASLVSLIQFREDIPEDIEGAELKKFSGQLKGTDENTAIYVESEYPINLIYLGYISRRNLVDAKQLETIEKEYQHEKVRVVAYH